MPWLELKAKTEEMMLEITLQIDATGVES